jgi:hypothetical protein
LEVDWTHLWKDLDWKKCVSSVTIFVDDVAVENVADVLKKTSSISVEPCRDLVSML